MEYLVINTQAQLLAFIQSELEANKNLSMRGVARLCDVDAGGLSKALNSSVDVVPHKLAQKLSQHGFEGVDLVKTGFDAKATWLTIEYYAYESKAEAAGAKQIARTFGMLGVMTTFDKLTEQAPEPKPEPIKEYGYEFKLEVARELEKIRNGNLPDAVKQLIIDDFTNGLFAKNQLPAAEDRWLGVVQRAEELGYKTNSSERSRLGKAISAYHNDTGKLERRQDKRLCNGIMVDVWCYRVTDLLDDAIASWFDHNAE